MRNKFIFYSIIAFTILSSITSCSVFFTKDYGVDYKVLNMAESEAYNLKSRSGVLEAYDPRASMAHQAGQRVFSSIILYLQESKKEQILEGLRYEIIVLNDAKMDCYSLGGGKIVIHAGLLNQLSSEDEIAYIIAHELAHEIEKHSYKKLKSSFISDIGMNVINNVVAPEDTSRELYLSAFGVTTSAFGAIKFSDKEELNADELALLWVSQARYNPKAANIVISKLENLSNSGVQITFVKVHPTSEKLHERIEQLSEKYFQEYFLPLVQGQ